MLCFPELEEQYVVEMAENSDDNDDDDDKDCSDAEGGAEEIDADVPDPLTSSIAEQEAEERDAESLPVHFHSGDCGDEGNGRYLNCYMDVLLGLCFNAVEYLNT